MSKLLDDIKRATEARQKLQQTRPSDRTQPGSDDEKPGKSDLHGQAGTDPIQQALAWQQAERAARELSKREVARTARAGWRLVAAASGTALAIGIGVGRLLEVGSEPAAVPAMQRAAQTQPGPPLQLQLETDFEQFGRRVSASTPNASNLTGVR